MRDLWNDLARRVRHSQAAKEHELPFGFADAVLRRLQKAGRQGSSWMDDWVAVLQPALGLAFGTALLCFLLQYRAQREVPSDVVTQTEALIQLAVLND